MTDPGLAVGITFIVVGSLMCIYGVVTCATTKGSVYNAEDVDAMVTATVMEEERQRKRDEALFEDFKPGEKTKKRKVIMA